MLSACIEMLNFDWCRRTICLLAMTMTLLLLLRGELLRHRAIQASVKAYTPRRFRNKATPLKKRSTNSSVLAPAGVGNVASISSLQRHQGTNGGVKDADLEQQQRQSTTLAGGQWVDRLGSFTKAPQVCDSSLKLISYNVLGPLHGESSKHDYAPVSVTKWTRRRDRLIEELRLLNADIYCLQEVTEKGLAETFIPGLRRIGLECSGFAPMQQRSRHSPVRGKMAHKHIGCAMFVNPHKIEVIASKRVHLRDFAPLDRCQSSVFYSDVRNKHHAMVMMLIQLKATNQVAIIANTHLYWNPLREDIKLVQTYAAARALSRFAMEMGFNDEQLPPLFFCGDLNTAPEMSFLTSTTTGNEDFYESAMFKMLRTGIISDSHPQHPDVWYPTLSKTSSSSSIIQQNPRLGDLKIDWKLQNIFQLQQFHQFAPLFTTKTDDFQGWIDHIFISDSVKVEMVLKPPIHRGDLEANIKNREFHAIPNKEYPSDHIPLGIIAKLSNSN